MCQHNLLSIKSIAYVPCTAKYDSFRALDKGSESDLDSDDSIRKKKRAPPKKKKKLSKSKKAPKEQGKKNNVGINVINLDDDKEDSPVFDNVIADEKRE